MDSLMTDAWTKYKNNEFNNQENESDMIQLEFK